VVRGAARFTVDGTSVDIPHGGVVAVRDPALVREAVALEAGTLVLVVGGRPGVAFTPARWEEKFLARGAPVAQTWHNEGMARVRVSTTVDGKLLAAARSALSPLTDAALLDEALAAVLDRHRGAEIDAAYAAYEAHPPEEADAWGDLASFREAASAS